MAGRIKALSLYRSILRAHDEFLPRSMKDLGDAYVKSEFRLHKNAKPEQASQFFTEWDKYLRHVEQTGRERRSIDAGLVDRPAPGRDALADGQNKGFGRDVPGGVPFSEEQAGQLEKLREEAAKAGKSGG
ncbi:hypothetical protein ACHAWF_018414 [Thalassiosira exigua]